jgi:hypothetical protein
MQHPEGAEWASQLGFKPPLKLRYVNSFKRMQFSVARGKGTLARLVLGLFVLAPLVSIDDNEPVARQFAFMSICRM